MPIGIWKYSSRLARQVSVWQERRQVLLSSLLLINCNAMEVNMCTISCPPGSSLQSLWLFESVLHLMELINCVLFKSKVNIQASINVDVILLKNN